MANRKLTIFQGLTNLLNGRDPKNPKQFKVTRDNLTKVGSGEYDITRLEKKQEVFLSNQWKKIDNELYQKAIFYEPTRIASYYDYESMEFCLAGETKIATPEGFTTIKELADKGRDNEFIVYSYDHNEGRVVPAMARNAHYTRDEMTYKITFDDGNHIIATYEHRLMRRDGSFARVKNLKVGDSMMPFYRKSFYNNQNYNWIYTCNSNVGHNGWVSEHNMLAEWAYQPLNENEEVHHIDFNGKNNLPENLKIMDRTEHRAYHARLNNEKLWSNPEYRKKMSEVARRKGKCSWDGKRRGKNNPAYFSIPWDNITNAAEKYKTLKGTARALSISHTKLQREITYAGYKDWSTFLDAYGIEKSKYSTARATGEKLKINHKIVSIEEHGIIPVYDLTVPNYKNFATDTIFSHNTPEISAALDIFMEEATTPNEEGKILEIYSEQDRIRAELEDLFYNRLDINTNLPSWVRNTVKYGDNFVYNKLIPNEGFVGVTQLPNIEITRTEPSFNRLTNVGDTANDESDVQTKFHWKNRNIEFNSFEISHFRLVGDDRRLPYGTSILEKARRIWKQLLLSEDAMLVYRITRAPERRVHKVFVGNMDDKDVDAYVDKVANEFRRNQIVDNDNGQVDTRYNHLAVDQDIFVPVRTENAQTPIDTLQGACIALDTRIPLLDGRTLELQEIIDEWDNGNRDLWVYSADPQTGKPAAGQITWAGVTRKDTDVMKITLDNGEEVIATPDHKFVHRTRGFVEAQNLSVGDSLMPFYTQTKKIKSNANDYHQVWDVEDEKWVFTHRMVKESVEHVEPLKEFIYDENFINDKYHNVIHHKDFNRFNNNPSNLIVMGGRDHLMYHKDHIKKTIWANPEENKRKISKGLTNYINSLSEQEKFERYLKNINDPEAKAKTTEKLLEWNKNPENLKSKGKKISESKSTTEFKERFSKIASEQWKDDEYRNKIFSKQQTLTFTNQIYDQFISVFETNLRLDKTLQILNEDDDFMDSFALDNAEIRSSITNLLEFTPNHVDKMLKQRGHKNFSNWKKYEIERRGYKNMRQWKYYVDKQEKTTLYNHKIVKIEYLTEKQDVGTITVDGNERFNSHHTFALESGIYVKNSNLGEIADIEYIQQKLFAALRIPKAFLGFEDAFGDGKNLAILDIRFARAVHRIQKSIVQELNRMAIMHLYMRGLHDDLDNFQLSLVSPSTQADLLKLERWREKIGLYQDAVSDAGNGFGAMSMTKAQKDILGFTEDEIRLDIQRQAVEKAAAEEAKLLGEVIKQSGVFKDLYDIYGINPNDLQMGATGEERDSDSQAGGFTGGGDLGGDLGGDTEEGGLDLGLGGDESGGTGGEELGGGEELMENVSRLMGVGKKKVIQVKPKHKNVLNNLNENVKNTADKVLKAQGIKEVIRENLDKRKNYVDKRMSELMGEIGNLLDENGNIKLNQ